MSKHVKKTNKTRSDPCFQKLPAIPEIPSNSSCTFDTWFAAHLALPIWTPLLMLVLMPNMMLVLMSWFMLVTIC